MFQKKMGKSLLKTPLRNIILFCAVVCAGGIFTAPSCFAKTVFVSKNGNNSNTGASWELSVLSIKTGLSKAASGDSVWVAEGIYTEGSLVEIKAGISLYGGFDGTETSINDRDTSYNLSIIDGNNSYQCVRNNKLIDGFHIRNGKSATTGGGILNYSAGTVSNCKVYSNSATLTGGGIYNYGIVTNSFIYSNTSSTEGGGIYNEKTISDSEIYSNSSSSNGGGIFNALNGTIQKCWVYLNSSESAGGGIYNFNSGTVTNTYIYSNTSKNSGGIFNNGTISGCKIYSNIASGSGGGVNNLKTITNSKIYSNSATTDNLASGGGVYNNNGSVLNCDIYKNYAKSEGGGVYNLKSAAFLTNSLIYLNSSTGCGGGVFNNLGYVLNSTVYKNRTDFSGAGIYNYSSGKIENSIIWNNKNAEDVFQQATGGVVNSCFSEANGEIGTNINANPLFINSSEDSGTLDFHLRNGSPCIDTGAEYVAPAADIEGNPRPGTDNKVDIGAYESPAEYLPGDYYSLKRLYVSKTGDNSDGLSWSTAFTSIQKAFEETGDEHYEIFVAGGTYYEGYTIFINSRISLIGGFLGNETFNSQRKASNKKTIIDGNNEYRCVYNYGVIDGFHIIRGYDAASGGGIYNIGKVTNCALYANSSNDGGGIYNYGGEISNSTLYSNTASGNGGGIFIKNGTISNSIIWNNKSAVDVYIHFYLYGTYGKISYSCFGEANGVNGNIKANPLFVNTSGDILTWDLHLQDGSPCIDAGTPDNSPVNDIEKNPRPGTDGKIDIGSYESPDDYLPAAPQPAAIFYISKTGDNSDGSSWSAAFTTINQAISAAKNSFDNNRTFEIWTAEGTYTEGAEVINPGRISLIGGFNGDETDINARDPENNKTIIDGSDTRRCVYNYGTIDGFQITNGKTADYGGGILNNSGKVTNCSVYENSASYGGGIYICCYGVVSNSAIYSNSSSADGAGIFGNSGSIIDCAVNNNSGTGLNSSAGGIGNFNGLVNGCTIYSNTATHSSGGVLNSGAVMNCRIYGNSGGGIQNTGTITNCVVYSNAGGGIYNSSGPITNCTVYANSATGYGAGIYNYSGTITNTIIWNNSSTDIYIQTGIIYYSCFPNASGTNNNIKLEPLFVNTSGDISTWDFKMKSGSPCIDKGTSAGAPLDDIAGTERPQGMGFDMGAYEFKFAVGDVNFDSKVDSADVEVIKKHFIKKIMMNSSQLDLADFNSDGKIDIADIIALLNAI